VIVVSQENWVNRIFPVGRRGSVNGQRPIDAITVLKRVVAVVPGGTILCSCELVCKAFSRCNWALTNSGYAIHQTVIEHTQSMHMNGRSIVGEIVPDSDVCCRLESSNSLIPYPYTHELNHPSMPLNIFLVSITP
jgi:hypothetical protein